MTLSSHVDDRGRICETVEDVRRFADKVPGVVIVHQLPDMSLLYMSEVGVRMLGVTLEEVTSISQAEFQKRFLNEQQALEYTPKIVELLESNRDGFVSYFQQVRTSKTREWDWYMSLTKILLRDKEDRPLLLITTASQIDPEHYFTAKANRLLEENHFLKNHYHEFALLTRREKEILGLMARGKSTADIAGALNISEATTETHRKNIRRKININSPYEIYMFAQAFNLV